MKDFVLRKQLNAIRKAKRAILVGAWKTIVLRTIQTMKAPAQKISEGSNINNTARNDSCGCFLPVS